MTDNTSVRAKARAAQLAEFADEDVPQIVKDSAEAIYGGIDTLDTERRSLLVEEALERAHGLIMNAAEHGQMDPEVAKIAAGLIGIAGYTNACTREDSDYTSTGDTRVTKILDAFKTMLKELAYSAVDLNEEERAAAAEISEKCRKIAEETGEDFMDVIERESGKFLAKVQARKASEGRLDAPAAASETKVEGPSRYDDDGMYL